MAQRVTVMLEDDLTVGPAEQTVRFSFDGTDYGIDLNAKNAARAAQAAGALPRACPPGRAGAVAAAGADRGRPSALG